MKLDYHNTTMAPTILCVDGNIAAGKSTVATELGTRLNAPVLLEPTDQWTLFKQFYDFKTNPDTTHPPYVCYSFEVEVQLSRLNQMYRDVPSDAEIVIVERDPFWQTEVFPVLGHRDGALNDKQIENLLTTARVFRYDCHTRYEWVNVYLDCPVPVCVARIQERDRDGEQKISPEYLTSLETIYKENSIFSSATVIANGDATPDQTVERVLAHLNKG
jgi:deoxyadenosine/deoxycytidine kinase